MGAAEVHGLVMRGRVIGEVEWKIAEKYWSKGDDKSQKKALDVHFRKAFRELSVTKDFEELNNMIERWWPVYSKFNLPEPQMKENLKTLKVRMDPYKIRGL